MHSREVIKLLEVAGFNWTGGRGDQRKFTHRDTARPVTIVRPSRDIAIGLLIGYEKQPGTKLRRR